MQHMKIIILFLLQPLVLILSKECISSQDNPTSIICSENDNITANLTYYLSSFSNITELSIIHSSLTAMPDLYNNNNNTQLLTLHLDNNQIQLITRNYSTIEYLYLTFNHIYALHESNLTYSKLKLLDLSHNPIQYILDDFFSDKQFPELQILKLTNALNNIKPHLLDNKFISFSSLKYLNELSLDENNFEEFSCSKTSAPIQWKLPSNMKKFSLGKNKLTSFDETCFLQILNLIVFDLHDNCLKTFSSLNFTLPYLSKLQLDYNLFTNVPSNLLHSAKQLTELDLSTNQLNLKEMKSKKQYLFPATLRILYLNSMTSDLSCLIFENLMALEQLHLTHLVSNRLKNCIFKKLIQLKTLNLRNNHLKTFDEKLFRPLLTMNQLHELDITSNSLRCESCSLRWLINFLKSQNKTRVTCLDQHEKEILINTLELSSCSSSHVFSKLIIIISLLISFLLFVIFFIYIYQHRKFPFSKFPPDYHMIPLRHNHRIHQNTTEDITNDNVMLVT